MSHESFWGSPDIWTCRGCPDGSPVDDEGFCIDCRDVYRREYEAHLDQQVLVRYEGRCITCKNWSILKNDTCERCIKEVYRPEGRWCDEHGVHFSRCSECGDQLPLKGVTQMKDLCLRHDLGREFEECDCDLKDV